MRNALLVFLCLVFTGLTGCTSMLLGGSGTSAGRPIGQDTRGSATVAQDSQITAVVKRRFAMDKSLAGAALSVQTRQGVVTLRGTLGAYEQRDLAVRLAADVEGVQRVQNQIAVKSRRD